jgi:predicted dehydrogenase
MVIRIGIVGMGWGANHARVLAELAPHFQITALCSRRPEKPQAVADELGLPAEAVETDWRRLVERRDVDLVVVTAPDHLHHPIVHEAVKSGKHVFCDKPLAMDSGEAAEMLHATENAGVAHFTGFTWRFAPPCATLKRLIDAGALGDVHYVDAHFRIGPPLAGKEWQLEPQHRRGGVFSNLMVHLLDLVSYLTGAYAGEVGTVAGWRVQASGDGTGVHQSGWVLLENPGRTVRARLHASQMTTLRASDPVRVEVHGTSATAIGYANPLRPHTQRVTLVPQLSAEPEPVTPLEFPGGPPAPPTAALPSGGLLRPTIRHLYEAHVLPRLTGAAPAPGTPTFSDGLAAQRLLDAALQSVESGDWVTA